MGGKNEIDIISGTSSILQKSSILNTFDACHKIESLPEDDFVKATQFTKTTYRDVYPAMDLTAAWNSHAGKVVVITGVSRAIARKVDSQA